MAPMFIPKIPCLGQAFKPTISLPSPRLPPSWPNARVMTRLLHEGGPAKEKRRILLVKGKFVQ